MYDELVKRLREHNGWALNETLDEAADAIEELSTSMDSDMAFVEEDGRMVIKFLPRWIPVTERLPELGEEVLVYYHWINPPEKGSIARDSMHIHDISMKPVWKKHLGGKVTHWMPLPEPPKEET